VKALRERIERSMEALLSSRGSIGGRGPSRNPEGFQLGLWFIICDSWYKNVVGNCAFE
jgi:hypothetical protein